MKDESLYIYIYLQHMAFKERRKNISELVQFFIEYREDEWHIRKPCVSWFSQFLKETVTVWVV